MPPETTMLHVRVDDKLKSRASEVLAGVGLTLSDAVRILLTRVAAEGGLSAGLATNPAAYDAWFRAKVRDVMDNPVPAAPRIQERSDTPPIIRVIGVGGCGGQTVEYMLGANLHGVDFINANTDAQMLLRSKVPTILRLGQEVTRGLGAGGDPELGKQVAHENRERIESVLQGSDMVFIMAGMGGGTGTGAAPVIAQIAKELGALTVAVVMRPFRFEGKKRHGVADTGITELQPRVDSLIVISNEELRADMTPEVTLLEAFDKANGIPLHAVRDISALITRPGLIDVDFADVRTVVSEMGMFTMVQASAVGANRSVMAAQRVCAGSSHGFVKFVSCFVRKRTCAGVGSSPGWFRPEDINLHDAKGLLVNVTAGPELSMEEFEAVRSIIRNHTGQDANVVIGTAVDSDMNGELRVSVFAPVNSKGSVIDFLKSGRFRPWEGLGKRFSDG